MMAERLFFKPMKINRILKKFLIFLKEVRMEIKKINWPTREQTIKYTLVVIGVSVTVAIFLGGLDFTFSSLLTKFIFK